MTYRFFHAAEVEQQEAASKTPEQLAAEAASIEAITHPKTHQELLQGKTAEEIQKIEQDEQAFLNPTGK